MVNDLLNLSLTKSWIEDHLRLMKSASTNGIQYWVIGLHLAFLDQVYLEFKIIYQAQILFHSLSI